jgi:hypothetical protein
LQAKKAWAEIVWLRVESSGWLFRKLLKILVQNRVGDVPTAEQLSASQKGLCPMDLSQKAKPILYESVTYLLT